MPETSRNICLLLDNATYERMCCVFDLGLSFKRLRLPKPLLLTSLQLMLCHLPMTLSLWLHLLRCVPAQVASETCLMW